MENTNELSENPRILGSDIQEMITRTRKSTGWKVRINADASIHGHARAVVRLDDSETAHILYDPSESAYLDHLVAHELAHVEMFAQATKTDRVISVVSSNEIETAAAAMRSDLTRLQAAGVPEDLVRRSVQTWVTGLASQVSSLPSDIFIERHLWRDYPDLRTRQRASLNAQFSASAEALTSRVANVTPPVVWRASTAMNFTLVRAMAELTGDIGQLAAYSGTEAESIGGRLYSIVEAATAVTLPQATAIGKAWARELGITRWFQWIPLNSLPAGIRPRWSQAASPLGLR